MKPSSFVCKIIHYTGLFNKKVPGAGTKDVLFFYNIKVFVNQ